MAIAIVLKKAIAIVLKKAIAIVFSILLANSGGNPFITSEIEFNKVVSLNIIQ